MDLNDQISAFVNYWAPHDDQREVFEAQLRDLLTEYGNLVATGARLTLRVGPKDAKKQ